MISGVLLVVYALAVARVTRLVTADKITDVPRERLKARLWRRAVKDPTLLRLMLADPQAEQPKLVYLLTCPWCVSVYVAAVAAPLAYWWGDHPALLVPALALAFSHVTGLLAKMEG